MPETIGLILLGAVGATEAGSGIAGLGTLAGTTISLGAASVSVATIVGAGTLMAVSIGLSYATRPDLPKPESGSLAIKDGIPIRQRGYWNCRLAGYIMLAQASSVSAYLIGAFHSGLVEDVTAVYFDDDSVGVAGDFKHGATGAVGGPGGIYGTAAFGLVLGTESQAAAASLISDPGISGTWTSAFRGRGTAYWFLVASSPADATLFAKAYPRGLPKPSVVARCSPMWDPRDGAQSRFNSATWAAKPNGVLQLIDYLSRADGGMGLDLDIILPPARLAQWMVEASLCDVDLGSGNIRYRTAGWYKFDNKPEDVINRILASFDGWLAPAGDGSYALTVGVYREPSSPPLTEKHIFDFVVNYGNADERLVNQVDVSFTDPAQGYVLRQIDAVRDEASIASRGIVRSQPLELSWVQYEAQAARLGARAMLRLNPKKSGTFVTSLYGLRYLGERWIKLQYPTVAGLEDCVIEIQDADADILGGRVTFNWILVDPAALAAL